MVQWKEVMSMQTLSYQDIFTPKQRVLFVMAHPDDVDVNFAGLICKLVEEKKAVHVVVVSNGARGSQDAEISEQELAEKRILEEKSALIHLGLTEDNIENFGFADGEVENGLELIGKIAEVIRRFKPDIVCTHEPENYYFYATSMQKYYVSHRDHRHTGSATLDAIYPFSRDRSFFKEHVSKGIFPHTVYDVFFTGDKTHNTRIIINDYVKKKKEALLKHESQFNEQVVNDILNDYRDTEDYVEVGHYIQLGW
jgi:LmbE family N-acetylglucosaminyl deacetylase